jgi:hypothetical protein
MDKMNERLPHMTPNGMLLDVNSASPKKKWGKKDTTNIDWSVGNMNPDMTP